MCWKLTIRTPKRHQNDIVLVYLLLTFNRFHTSPGVSIGDFDQVKAGLVNEV